MNKKLLKTIVTAAALTIVFSFAIYAEEAVRQTPQGETTLIDEGRYTVIGGPVKVISPSGLQGLYTLTEEKYTSLPIVDERVIYEKEVSWGSGTWVETRYYYTLNGEKLSRGDNFPSQGSSLANGEYEGEWLIDNTKPDAVNGKTNIRYRYRDGSFAGLGWNNAEVSPEYSQAQIDEYNKNPTTFFKDTGKANYFFSEDGYLIRNMYYHYGNQYGNSMIGADGTWLDRMEYESGY